MGPARDVLEVGKKAKTSQQHPSNTHSQQSAPLLEEATKEPIIHRAKDVSTHSVYSRSQQISLR